MPNVFNTAEVIGIGIEKEKKRRDFYGYAAEKFKNKDMKELFTRLRDWEESHIKKFGEIKDAVSQSQAMESYKGEAAAYMRALVDDLLYKQISKEWFAQNVKSQLSAIQYGIGFERDAILFFNELLKYTAPSQKNKIEEIINEERQHIVYLAEIRRNYEK